MHNDNVNHPSHYTSGPFECIELTSRYPFLGGNAIKYVYRWQDKNGLEDLRKALWHLNRAKEESPYEPIGLYPLDSLVPPFCCESAPAFRRGEESQLSFFHITRNMVLLEI